MSSIKAKRLVLVTGDEYENVELHKNVPSWLKENVPEDFIGVKSDTFEIIVNSSMIVSVELDGNISSKLELDETTGLYQLKTERSSCQ